MKRFELPDSGAPGSGEGRWRDAAVGIGAAGVLFVLVAVVQMIGDLKAPEKDLDESLIAFTPPPIEELEEEPPPPPEEEEPPPEPLEPEPPTLSLDQLDIALDPGTGGSLVGDFALPTIQVSSSALGTDDFVDFSELDQIPRPLEAGLPFPSRLKRKKVTGRIVLLFKLDEKGSVLDVSLESSTLPEFNGFVLSQAKSWRFSPPTKQGRPVRAKARLPIPINIK